KSFDCESRTIDRHRTALRTLVFSPARFGTSESAATRPALNWDCPTGESVAWRVRRPGRDRRAPGWLSLIGTRLRSRGAPRQQLAPCRLGSRAPRPLVAGEL